MRHILISLSADVAGNEMEHQVVRAGLRSGRLLGRRDQRFARLQFEPIHGALEHGDQLVHVGRGGHVLGVDGMAVGRDDIHMDGPGRQLGLQGLVVDALVFLAFLGRGGAVAAIVLVRGIDRNEIAVDQVDRTRIGERTRSQGIGPASAAADGHAAIVREQEDRPLSLPAQSERFTDVLDPADVVEAALVRGRLPVPHAIFHPAGKLGIADSLCRRLSLGQKIAGCEAAEGDARYRSHSFPFVTLKIVVKIPISEIMGHSQRK